MKIIALYQRAKCAIDSCLVKLFLRYKKSKACQFFPKEILSCGGRPILQIYGQLFLPTGKMCFVNDACHSTLGIQRRCKLLVYPQATLRFEGNVGMSNVSIIATQAITIGQNVILGGNVTIADSDFHSMDSRHWFTEEDAHHMSSEAIVIGDNVFIGMNAIILKGVHIGNNAIVGAGSVVTKDIPANEIWAGNPAKFIKHR